MNKYQKKFSVGLIALTALFTTAAWAQTLPAMGTASNFAVLSAAPTSAGAVTCTGSTISGNVGSSGSMTSVVQTGCTINGTIIAPVSAQALTDFNNAYDQYANIPCTGTLGTAYTGAAITLTPGVYCNAAAVTFTDSTLTLDGLGDANAVWIFKVGTGGTGALTGTNLSVIMTNGGKPCNVYWWVAQATTLTTSTFQGTILSGAAITMTGLAGTTTPFNGNALAKAAVTLTSLNVAGCKSSGSSGGGNNGGGKGHNKCGRDDSHDDDDHDDDSHDEDSHGGGSHKDDSHGKRLHKGSSYIPF
jgi:hypothetical protein